MAISHPQLAIIGRGIAGAAVGAVLGWFAFSWLIDQGLYALALPSALVGLACGVASGGASRVNAVACAVIGIAESLVLEWRHFPFLADDSFGYFVGHLHELRGITWLMLIAGGALAFWFGWGRVRTK